MTSTKVTGTTSGAPITADTPAVPISNHTGHCTDPRRERIDERVTTASEAADTQQDDLHGTTSADP